jgi:hypothetical protein
LQAERQQVMQALLQMDCSPAGMELFPAADEEQFEFIKTVINDCDYYILIVGGRYGSITAEGISFTEKEYDYAVEIGLPVIAFIHGNPDEIPAGKTELDPVARERLDIFRERVSNGRLIKQWTSPAELPGLVALSISNAIKTHPAVGWVRGNIDTNEELLAQINELRKQNEMYRVNINKNIESKSIEVENLSCGEDIIEIHGVIKTNTDSTKREWSSKSSWDQIFNIIGPELFENKIESTVRKILAKGLNKLHGYVHSIDIYSEDFNTIKIQFIALGYVEVNRLGTTQGGVSLFWSLSELGEKYLMNLRAVRKI